MRRAHPADGGHFFGTVIHHARDQRCTFAQAQRAVPIAVVRPATGRSLVVSPSCPGLLRPGRQPARRGAVDLAAVARSADREHAHAELASLEAEQHVVHRFSDRNDDKLAHRAGIEHRARSRRPSAWGSRTAIRGPASFRRPRGGRDVTAASSPPRLSCRSTSNVRTRRVQAAVNTGKSVTRSARVQGVVCSLCCADLRHPAYGASTSQRGRELFAATERARFVAVAGGLRLRFGFALSAPLTTPSTSRATPRSRSKPSRRRSPRAFLRTRSPCCVAARPKSCHSRAGSSSLASRGPATVYLVYSSSYIRKGFPMNLGVSRFAREITDRLNQGT